jgi:hypothetical protein
MKMLKEDAENNAKLHIFLTSSLAVSFAIRLLVAGLAPEAASTPKGSQSVRSPTTNCQ